MIPFLHDFFVLVDAGEYVFFEEGFEGVDYLFFAHDIINLKEVLKVKVCVK